MLTWNFSMFDGPLDPEVCYKHDLMNLSILTILKVFPPESLNAVFLVFLQESEEAWHWLTVNGNTNTNLLLTAG